VGLRRDSRVASTRRMGQRAVRRLGTQRRAGSGGSPTESDRVTGLEGQELPRKKATAAFHGVQSLRTVASTANELVHTAGAAGDGDGDGR
jgi:hypothetical protein